ncbi:MAG TPA: hypothetical protein VMV93_06680 [Chloroflexota bacterium]|nr:hypothetical protein [Chloroflexota bacterium]
MAPEESGSSWLVALLADEELAVAELVHACDDYCAAVAAADAEQAEDAQRARNRARTRLTTVHQRLQKALAEHGAQARIA